MIGWVRFTWPPPPSTPSAPKGNNRFEIFLAKMFSLKQ